MIVTTVKEQVINMDEVVTRRILAEEFTRFEERFEIKMERMIDLKIDEKFEEKFNKALERIEEQFNIKFQEQEIKIDRKFEQQHRDVFAVIEDQNHKIQMLAEGIMMQIETNERKWQEQGGLYGFLEKRVTHLESQLLTA